MPRNLPGKIIREALPGPEMTEDQFRIAIGNLPIEAARWRWLQRNLSTVLEWPLELMSGVELGARIDQMIRRGV